MDTATRLSKLNEIKDLIFAFEDAQRCEVDAHYFTGSCFERQEIRGISFRIKDKEQFENLLGYLDIPAMLNGLLIANTSLSADNYGFVYDDDKFSDTNLKKLNIYQLGKLKREDTTVS